MALNCFLYLPYLYIENFMKNDITSMDFETLVNKIPKFLPTMKKKDRTRFYLGVYFYAFLNLILIIYSLSIETWICIPYALIGLLIVSIILPTVTDNCCFFLGGWGSL
jgi:hypothetical protein